MNIVYITVACEDAFTVELLISKRKIVLKNMEMQKKDDNLGHGELAAFAATEKFRTDAIITDDARFIAFLEMHDIPFITPSDVIVWLVRKKKMRASTGKAALEKMRPFIKETAYKPAKELIGGNRK